MSSKGNSGGGGMIQPCYDGRLLPGLHQVAGEGLSAISVKRSHRHCKFITDPKTRQPLVTCHQGIHARNTFWNLHKPDLTKLKELKCSTSESVAQLFRAHNVQNSGKPTYKKRMLRLLESLVPKKAQTPETAVEVLIQKQNRQWPAHQCVLAPLLHEADMKSSKTDSSHGIFSTFQLGSGNDLCNEMMENSVDTVDLLFMSQPHGGNMLSNSSENTLIGIAFTQALEAINGDISSNLFTPLKETSGLDTARAPSIYVVPSCLKLTNKQPLPHISTDGNPKHDINQGQNNHQLYSSHNENDEHPQACTNDYIRLNEIDFPKQGSPSTSLSSPSSLVVDSLVDEMLEEMRKIEDYISSYTSSFCVREEEFTNYQTLRKKPSEVVEHFFEEARSIEKEKLKSLSSEQKSTDQFEDGRTVMRQLPDLVPNNELELMTNMVGLNISSEVVNIHEGNLDIVLPPNSDSGIDINFIEFDDEKSSMLDSKSFFILENNNNSSINMIEFDVNDETGENDCTTETTSMNREPTNNISKSKDVLVTEFVTQENTLLPLQNYALEDLTVIDNLQMESLQRFNELSDKTSDIINAASSYCIWDESGVVINTRLPTLTTDIFSHTDSVVTTTFMEEVWKEYLEGVNDEDYDLFRHVHDSELCDDAPFSSYSYWDTLDDVEANDEAEDIDSFLLNRFKSESNYYYNDSCTIVEIEDEVVSRTEKSGKLENFRASKDPHSHSRCTENISDTNIESKSNVLHDKNSFKVHETKSQYSESDGRHLISHHSGDIDAENGLRNAAPSRVTKLEKNTNADELNNKDSAAEGSRLVYVPGNTDEFDSKNTQMIFTSPNIKLNFTNSTVNQNKKL